MKKYIILAALGLVSIANATTVSNGCDTTPTASPLYYCNLSTPTDWNGSCDNAQPTCDKPTSAVSTCGNANYADCTGGNNPWCGGGTPKCQVPDAANSLWLLGTAMTVLGGLRKKFAAQK